MSLVKNAHNILLRVVVLELKLVLIKVYHPPFLGVTGNPLFCKLINNRLPGYCYNRLKVAVTSCVAFLLSNQWKFNVCLVSMPKSTEVNINIRACKNFAVLSGCFVEEKISCLRQKLINRYPD